MVYDISTKLICIYHCDCSLLVLKGGCTSVSSINVTIHSNLQLVVKSRIKLSQSIKAKDKFSIQEPLWAYDNWPVVSRLCLDAERMTETFMYSVLRIIFISNGLCTLEWCMIYCCLTWLSLTNSYLSTNLNLHLL